MNSERWLKRPVRLKAEPELNNQGRGKCYQPSRRPRLITFTETLVLFHYTMF